MSFAKKGDYERAIDDLNKSDLINPKPSSMQETQGSGLIDKQWFLGEMTKSTTMIKSDPQAFDAYLERGTLYARVTDYDRALADFDEAIRLKGDLAEAYHQRGKAYEAIGRKDEAIAAFSKFLELAQNEAARGDAKEHLRRLGVVK